MLPPQNCHRQSHRVPPGQECSTSKCVFHKQKCGLTALDRSPKRKRICLEMPKLNCQLCLVEKCLFHRHQMRCSRWIHQHMTNNWNKVSKGARATTRIILYTVDKRNALNVLYCALKFNSKMSNFKIKGGQDSPTRLPTLMVSLSVRTGSGLNWSEVIRDRVPQCHFV